MNDQKFKIDVMFKLGEIAQHLKNLNGATEDNKKLGAVTAKKVAKHEVLLGKIGVVLVGAVFVVSTAINFSWDWIRSKF